MRTYPSTRRIMISFTDSLWCCTVSVWPIGVTPANQTRTILGQFCFWPLVMRCLYFFTFSFFFFLLCFASSIHQSHTQRDYLLFSWFPPGRVPMFFFPSLTLTSQPSSSYFPPSLPLSSSSLAFLFGCEEKLFIYSDKIYFPPSPPPILQSFSRFPFTPWSPSSFPPGYVLVEYHCEGEKGGEKKGEWVNSAVEVEEKFFKRE